MINKLKQNKKFAFVGLSFTVLTLAVGAVLLGRESAATGYAIMTILIVLCWAIVGVALLIRESIRRVYERLGRTEKKLEKIGLEVKKTPSQLQSSLAPVIDTVRRGSTVAVFPSGLEQGKGRANDVPRNSNAADRSFTFFAPNCRHEPSLVRSDNKGEFVLLDSATADNTVMVIKPDKPVTWDVNLNGAKALKIKLGLSGDSDNRVAKAGIFFITAYDSRNSEIDIPRLPKKNLKFGNYEYLSSETTECVLKLEFGEPVDRVTFGVVGWAEDLLIRNRIVIEVDKLNNESKDLISDRLNIACILDPFSFESFKFEANFIPLTPHGWRDQINGRHIDLFLCESAWTGVGEDKPWRGRVYKNGNMVKENRAELLELLGYFKENSIPTVFWNKEDPSHYDDRVHDFVSTAKLFDYVFTTDRACVSRYRDEHGIKNIDVLQFGVQPRLYNPIGRQMENNNGVVFAGGWYQNHSSRCADMRAIFDCLVENKTDLAIYDRFYGTTDPLHEMPEEYRAFVREPVSQSTLNNIYKNSRAAITINTVTKSPTMFARRIYEIAATNTPILSNECQGIREEFGELVFYGAEGVERYLQLSTTEVSKRSLELTRKVFLGHTYKDRLQQVLEKVGVPGLAHAEPVAVLFLDSDQESLIRRRISELKRANFQIKQFILVITDRVRPNRSADLFNTFNRSSVRVLEPRVIEDYSRTMRELLKGVTLVLASSVLSSSVAKSGDAEMISRCAEFFDLPVAIGRCEGDEFTVHENSNESVMVSVDLFDGLHEFSSSVFDAKVLRV